MQTGQWRGLLLENMKMTTRLLMTTTAALLAGKAKFPAGTPVLAIVSGGNVDLARFPH